MMKLLNTRTGYGKVGDREKTGRESINVRYAQVKGKRGVGSIYFPTR